jgi:hypothetical protein
LWLWPQALLPGPGSGWKPMVGTLDELQASGVIRKEVDVEVLAPAELRLFARGLSEI